MIENILCGKKESLTNLLASISYMCVVQYVWRYRSLHSYSYMYKHVTLDSIICTSISKRTHHPHTHITHTHTTHTHTSPTHTSPTRTSPTHTHHLSQIGLIKLLNTHSHTNLFAPDQMWTHTHNLHQSVPVHLLCVEHSQTKPCIPVTVNIFERP